MTKGVGRHRGPCPLAGGGVERNRHRCWEDGGGSRGVGAASECEPSNVERARADDERE